VRAPLFALLRSVACAATVLTAAPVLAQPVATPPASPQSTPLAQPTPLAQSARPDAPGALELRSVVESVQRALPTLLAAERDRDAADAEMLAAEGGFDPVLRGRASVFPIGYYRYVTGDVTVEQPTPLWGSSLFVGYRIGVPIVPGSAGIPDYYGMQQTNSAGELRAGVAVPLVRNGPIDRRRANIQVRSQGRVLAEADLARARIEASRFAAVRYWDWVAAGRKLTIARDVLRVARERDVGLATRVQAGDLPRYERQDNQRAVLSRESGVIAAQQSLQRAAIELSLFYRDADGAPLLAPELQLPPELPLPDAAWTDTASQPAREDEAVAARPELRRFDAQRAQARVELDLARNQALPVVDIVAQVSQDLGPSVSSSDTRGRTELSAGLVLEVPLVMRAQIGRVRAAEAALARVEAQRTFARDRVVADVRDAVASLRAALERTEIARRELAVAREVEQAERERFRQGDSNIFLVNQREQTTAEASVRLVDATADWLRARAAFRAAMGQQ
jgi:cobalt-zinc-cadmium efflux system outer membrane protein